MSSTTLVPTNEQAPPKSQGKDEGAVAAFPSIVYAYPRERFVYHFQGPHSRSPSRDRRTSGDRHDHMSDSHVCTYCSW